MMFESYVLRDLILKTRDGDWGKDEAKDGFVPYRVIRGGDFPEVELGDIEKVPRCYLKESTVQRRTLKAGDLLIETAGGTANRPTGRVLYISQDLLNKLDLPVTCASFARFIRLDEKKVNPQYLFWHLRAMYERGEMWQHQVQHTGIARFQWTIFADSHVVDLPKRSEQDRLVEILGSLNRKIELNRQINQTLEHIAQAIFKSWFVDFEPVKAKIQARRALTLALSQRELILNRAAMCAINGNLELRSQNDEFNSQFPIQNSQLESLVALFPDELEDSDHGQIPTGWDQKPLYETAGFINGAAFKSKDFSLGGDGLPIVKIAELKSGITTQTKFTIAQFPEKYLINDDEVLYSWSGSPNTSLEVFKWFGGTGWLNQHIFRVITKNPSSKYFVFFLLRQLKPRLIAIATDKQTTGLGHVTVADMKRLHVPYPNEGLLECFGRIVGPLYEAASNNEKQSVALTELRESLLLKLLSGEISVSTLQPKVDEVA